MTGTRAKALLLTATLSVAIGCAGEPGVEGAAGTSVSVRTTAEPSGANCAIGGTRVEFGADGDGDGTLDDAEVSSTAWVCDGETGAEGQGVTATAEPPGDYCAEGGVALALGGGAPTYVCDGAPGADGLSVTLTPEPAGPNCEYGGQALQVGAGSPTFVCDGAPGADGLSVTLTPEPAGAFCDAGGVELQVGTGAPAYLCNGTDGADGQSVTMVPEPAGSNCEFGGVSLRVGAGPVEFVCNGSAPGVTRPIVQTAPVTDARYVEASVEGTVLSDGGELVLVRGVVLATHPAPTVADALYLAGSGEGAFVTACGGLAPDTTYFVRAFATNALGTAYGDERSFTTRALTVPALSTHAASNVTTSTALSGGTIADDGGTPILDRGICWSTVADPLLGGSCSSEGIGAGTFLAMATGLSPGTGYHVRGYAVNAQGTSYGDDVTFTTLVLPLATVTTSAPSAVAHTTASVGASVVSDNGSPVTSRGVCWSTTPAPTTSGAKVTEAGGIGSFTAALTGLATNTTYYARAFAENGGGTSYGNEVTFTTLAPALPTLTTRPVVGISNYMAGSGGVVGSDGGSAITARGVCWSLNPNPTVANARTLDGTGAGSFNSTMSGLVALTTYYVRAYATNALGTAYGGELGFTTTDVVTGGPFAPVVGTTPITMTGPSTAAGGGYVSNDGGSPVTARGLCWGTTANPDLSATCSTEGGTSEGFFTSAMAGLTGCNTTYYVRAYATNSVGTGYGTQVTIATGVAATPTTDPVTGIGYYTATSGGTVDDGGGCAITARGVAYGLTPNPTVAGQKTVDGAGNGAFVSSLTGLYANRTYYARAYATNAAGTVYGPQVTFATLEPSTPYVGGSSGGGVVVYLDGTGLHGLVVAAADQGNAPWGCSGTSIPTSSGIGIGATNTAMIIASCSQTGIAARVADDMVLNGFDDWFLPSRDELFLAYTTFRTLGFPWTTMYTLTSTERSATEAWALYSPASSWGAHLKTTSVPIRPMRAF